MWLTKSYIMTRPALSKAPPMMSLSQCTPENSLPMSMKQVKTRPIKVRICLIGVHFMRVRSCMIVVDITQSTSMVVDDG